MAKFVVYTKFVFTGTVTVEASDEEQAEDMVKRHVGLVLGGDVHTTLPGEQVDWEFTTHPTKIIEHVVQD